MTEPSLEFAVRKLRTLARGQTTFEGHKDTRQACESEHNAGDRVRVCEDQGSDRVATRRKSQTEGP